MLVLAGISMTARAQTTGTNEWSWLGGSSSTNQAGVYGTLGTPAAGNVPGSRRYASQWTDANGNLWLFGGDGYDSLGQENGLNDLWMFNPSTGEWTWMGGDSTLPCTSFGQCGEYPGIYGTLGTPAPGNAPGSRNAASSWTDFNGNLWLFGGDGIDALGLPDGGLLNDLWEYNPSTNQWAWMSGSSTLTCVWESGGYCGAPGQYDGTPGAYAAGNVPAGRFGAFAWTDSKGMLWLFGGMTMVEAGADTYLNDLWQFNPSANQWIWMGGDSAAPCPVGVACDGASGVYGTLGTPSPANLPGAREFGVTWTDSSGNLWLFGGQGMVAGGGNYLNDLWEFSPSTNEWTWMGGSNTIYTKGGAPGVYGALGTPAAGNFPGARQYASSWTDGAGNFWLFGGQGFDVNGTMGYLNDLWEYNLSANQWTWMGGSDTAGSIGIYDKVETRHAASATYSPLGTPSAGPAPGSRITALGWTDKDGNLWLFGGSNGPNGFLNDLWKFKPASAFVPPAVIGQPSSQTVPAGSSATFNVTATGASALTYDWQYLSGSKWKDFAAGTGSTTATLTTFATTPALNGLKFRVVVTDAKGHSTASDTVTLTIAPAIATQPVSSTVPDGSAATFSVMAVGVPNLTYQWQYLSGTTWKEFAAGTGYTTATLTTVATTSIFDNLHFRVVVTDRNGLNVTSNAATLTVGPAITAQPASQTVAIGSAATFAVTAAGVTNLTYEWQYLSGTTWKKFAAGTGYTTATLTTVPTTSIFNDLHFRVVVTDGNGLNVTSNTATLTVGVAP